jgi:hypothetical protein
MDEHNRAWLASGLKLGAAVSALSWFGNLRHYDSRPQVVSAFPDLLTVIALPILLFIFLRLVARNERWTRTDIRRVGMFMVIVAATFYASAHVLLGIVVFSRFFSRPLLATYPLEIFGFAMAFISFSVFGWLSVWITSKWLMGRSETLPS